MKNIPIIMVRKNLDNIPQYDFPRGYSLQGFEAGDVKPWLHIWAMSDLGSSHGAVTLRVFKKHLGCDMKGMYRRGFFLVSPDGQDIGTITSWYHRYRGLRWGRIHFAAIVPEYRSRGLAKPMMCAAMNHLRLLGHKRVMLTTESHRIPAIKVYRDFGFTADMTTKNASQAWKEINRSLRDAKK
jgi:ribosomal protein S18 acetylase RimI-like enzyme